MSERVFASLAPFWIGIVANIRGVNFIFFGMWIVLIAWSVINWFTYSAK